MNEKCFRLDPDDGVVPIAADEIKTDRGSTESTYWIDLANPTPDQISTWLELLGVAPSIVRMLGELPTVPRVQEAGDLLLVQVPLLRSADDPQPDYTTLIAAPHFCVTVHESESLNALFPQLADTAVSKWMRFASPAGLIDKLVELGVERGFDLAQRVRGRLLRLQEVADETPDTLDIGEILTLKRLTGRVQAVLEDQQLCVEQLVDVSSTPLDLAAIRSRLVAGARSLDHLGRRADRSQARLDEIHRHASLNAQEAANRRLNALTIVQAIFVPLTLLAGIYGMNFVMMPELHWAPSYFVVLALMVLIATGELIYFWRRGWFD